MSDRRSPRSPESYIPTPLEAINTPYVPYADRVVGKPACKTCGYRARKAIKWWPKYGWLCPLCKIRQAIEAHQHAIRRLERRLHEVIVKRNAARKEGESRGR